MRLIRISLTLALVAAVAVISRAQVGSVSLAVIDAAYTQDFNTLAISGTSSTVPAGWGFAETLTNANTLYTAGTGSSNAGDTYSFGPASSTERALGGLRSGNLVPFIGAAFTNNTGQTISTLEIAYTGEQWRLGTSGRGADRLDFQYSLDATSLTTGTWVDVNELDFTGPVSTGTVGPLNGEAPGNRVAISGAITGLALSNGATIRIRWTDVDVTSSDDGLAVDDFSIIPRAGGMPALSINDVAVDEGDSGTTLATFTITLSTPMHGGVTFDIATADGTATVADNDYAAASQTSVAIAPGASSTTFAVTVNGDTSLEADETFLVNVTNVTGAAVSDPQGLGLIRNDDEAPPVTNDVVISQVYGGGGNAGATYTHDFVELFNRGTATINLSGWSVQYTSASGSSWQVTPLSGSIAPGQYFLVRQAAGTNPGVALPTPDVVGSIPMGASAGKVALQVTTAPITTSCPLSNTADLVAYGGANCFEGTGPTAAVSNTTAAQRKRGGCYDSDNNSVDFAVGNPSPRNTASPTRTCGTTPVAIHTIQGSALTSPLADTDVLTSGIVTGVKSNGFFLQSPDGAVDADPMTSEAIYVFTGATPAVAPGHQVSVRGTVGEFFNLTQVEASLPGDVTVQSTGGVLPSPVLLTPAILNPTGPLEQLEPLEGMRVFAPSLTSVAPTDNFGEIATVLTGVPRPMREPGISVLDPVPPDPTSGVVDCCIPRFDENPERIFVDSEGLLGRPVLHVTSNVVLANVVGPLDFTFSRYKIVPETTPLASPDMTAIPVPAPAPDEFTVGSFNIENFAGSETQKRKAALAIRQSMRSPDVISVIEVLNLGTLQMLADQLNSDAMAAGEPNPAYEARLELAPPRTPGGPPGTQNVGFLVKTSRVRIDAVTQALASQTWLTPDNVTELLHDRPPLVLHATVDANGTNPRSVIVVVNHLRSFIDVELIGGAGPRVRAKRTAQAEAVAVLLQQLQTDHGGVPIISVGDYNAFQFNDGYTDPIAILKGQPTPDDQLVVDGSPDLVEPDFINLTDTLPAAERYSFIFEGTPQALDHVLVNTVAASYVQRYAVARGNADVPRTSSYPLYSGDPTRPEGASDHDMPVAYFRFPDPSADLRLTKVADVTSAATGGQITYTIAVTNAGASPAQNVVVADQMPAHVSLVSCAASDGGVCGGTTAAPAVSFGTVAPGATVTVSLVGAVDCSAPNGAMLTNVATVSSDTGDPDTTNNTATAAVSAVNAPPSITGLSASRSTLLPNHQMVPVEIQYTAADACGPVTTRLTVTSNEAVTAHPSEQGGAGLTSPDWEIVDAHTVRLRGERSPKGDARVYTVTVIATDAAGQESTAQVTVTVPKSAAGGGR